MDFATLIVILVLAWLGPALLITICSTIGAAIKGFKHGFNEEDVSKK